MAWVTLKALHEQTGIAVRTLQYIRAQEPGVLITRERAGGKTEYKQPDCATNLRRRERELADKEKQKTTFFEARDRAMLAEAQLKEHALRKQLDEVIDNALHEKVVAGIGDRLRAILINLPATYGLRLEEAGVPADRAEALLSELSLELIDALRGTADELDEEAATIETSDDPAPPDADDEADAGSGTPAPGAPGASDGGAGDSPEPAVAAQAHADGVGG